MTAGPASRGPAGRRPAGFFSWGRASAVETDLEAGPNAEVPSSRGGLIRWLPRQLRVSAAQQPSHTGSGSSQWPAGAEAGGGGSVRAAGLLSRGAGARAPRLLLYSALRRQLAALRASCLPAPRPGLLLSRGPWRRPSRPSPAPSHLWPPPPPPRPQTRWRCATETPRSVSGVGRSLPHRFRTEAGFRGRGVSAWGPSLLPPPSPPAQPCGPGSGVSESRRPGPVACFLLASGRCFVDFCLRVGVPAPAELWASGRASAFRGQAALAPASPALLWGAEPAEGGPRVGVGRRAGVCVSERVCVCV